MAEAPDNIAPSYYLEVGNQSVEEITPYVQSLEYESADGIADVARITLVNPNNILSESKIFQPYNEMAIWIGYANPIYIGRVILNKPKIQFPPNGMPTIQIVGYTKDWVMSKTNPADSKRREQQSAAFAKAGNQKLAKAIKRINYKDATISEVVEYIASENFLKPDVDDVDIQEVADLDRPADVSDYDFVKSLANVTGYVFWVDADLRGRWWLHFKSPENLLQQQDKVYTFRYGQGATSSLINFDPEVNFSDKYTELRVQAFANQHTYSGGQIGTIMDESFVVDDAAAAPDLIFDGDTEAGLNKTFVDAETVEVYVGDYSFKLIAMPHINTPEKLRLFATAWFQRNRNNFIKGDGRIVGLETLMARQEHNIEGLGKPYDGRYYFSKVKHSFGNHGYLCDFHARKTSREVG